MSDLRFRRYNVIPAQGKAIYLEAQIALYEELQEGPPEPRRSQLRAFIAELDELRRDPNA